MHEDIANRLGKDIGFSFVRKLQGETGFWERVRAWIAKDWTVGMHGDTHVMHPTHSKLVLPFYPSSEFAGLPLEAQAQRIRAGWQLFRAQDIEPTLWIAPAHSFDLATLAAVRAETSMRVVSDGIGWDTWYEHGFYWIPQQLWGFRYRPFAPHSQTHS